MINPVKVFLAGGDGLGLALDDDLSITRRALGGLVCETSLSECEVVHLVWWEGLLAFSPKELSGKRILCHVPGEPRRYFSVPAHRHIVGQVGVWVTRSHQATRQFRAVGREAEYVPYAIDTDVFRPLENREPGVSEFRRRWAIPGDRYLIGNFHRDSEGADLNLPKLVKGPDLFVEMITAVHRAGAPIHVLLAGPRRHWIRNQLDRAAIPYTFVGIPCVGDDVNTNILDRATLNQLYNLLDLYVVSSRSEGGPQSVMEAAAARCPIVSSRVGVAEDILDSTSIYRDVAMAQKLILDDIRSRCLRPTLNSQQQRVLSFHNIAAVAPRFHALYAKLDRVQTWRPSEGAPPRPRPALLRRIAERIGIPVRTAARKPLTIGVWHTFFKPPYGGGNQFMLALTRALRSRGLEMVENELSDKVDVYLLNSVHFDVSAFDLAAKRRPPRVVHRIDGPISLVRGSDREKDELCFLLNQRFASATVLQSAWTHEQIVAMGYQPVRPVHIMNAADPAIFSRSSRPASDAGKVRLISTSWSDNPRKGGATYKWLDENLDWERFDYTFVGRTSERFRHIRHIDPVPSEELADLLRQHDIFVFASRYEPCSNALIEALTCGLPALYSDSASNPEVVGYGGLPFTGTTDILAQLDSVVENRATFQNLIQVPTLDQVADRYLEVLREVAQG